MRRGILWNCGINDSKGNAETMSWAGLGHNNEGSDKVYGERKIKTFLRNIRRKGIQ